MNTTDSLLFYRLLLAFAGEPQTLLKHSCSRTRPTRLIDCPRDYKLQTPVQQRHINTLELSDRSAHRLGARRGCDGRAAMHSGQDLRACVCGNTSSSSERDVEVIIHTTDRFETCCSMLMSIGWVTNKTASTADDEYCYK